MPPSATWPPPKPKPTAETAAGAEIRRKSEGKGGVFFRIKILVQGSNGFLLPVSLKRIAAVTVVATYKRGMQPVATSRRDVSADGQVMTITTVVTGKDGKTVTTVGVYEKSTQP